MFLKKRSFLKKLSFSKKNLLKILSTMVKEGSSLTIVKEMTNFIKMVVFGKTKVFEKKIHATLLNVVLHEV